MLWTNSSPSLYGAVGVLQVQRARPDGFDLRAAQLDARLVLVLHEVIVVGLAVLGRDFDSLFLRGGPPRFPIVKLSQYTTVFP